ncbi:MAG TPA: hypothetical protein ENI15_07050 [Spirochaetes bacterium]|nr:hypothetical protein [Spirochaetota bacterium]
MKEKYIHTLFIAGLLLSFFFSGMGNDAYAQKSDKAADGEESKEDFEAASGMFEGLDAMEAMALANKLGEGKNSFTSFITPESINIKIPGGKTFSVPLPEDRMVVAIAPYVKTTHKCSTHYMSGCKGELFEEDVSVIAKKKDGSVILSKDMKTMSNGFIELWLPRDLEIDLTIVYKDMKSGGTITTNSDSKTCITTFQLK